MPEAPCQAFFETPRGQKHSLVLTQTTEGYQTIFAPHEPGPHKLYVSFNGQEVPKSPYYVNVEHAIEVGAVEVSGLDKRKFKNNKW